MDVKAFLQKIKEKKIEKNQILILFLTGLLLVIISIPSKGKEAEKESEFQKESEYEQGEEREYIKYLESHLEETLSQMEGAGDVVVMVTLASSAEAVVEKDLQVQDEHITENDSQGGSRITSQASHEETTIYSENEGNGQEPYVSKEILPKVEGVVVLAEGGDQAVIVKNITEVVQALFGIETHKIRIGKKGG